MTSMTPLVLDHARLFPSDPKIRELCFALYSEVEHAPIISPHNHTDAAWFANNQSFSDALSLLVIPDHYLLRMLHSQGISLLQLGVPDLYGKAHVTARQGWQCFAQHYHLFLGTPSRLWLDATFREVFDLDIKLDAASADFYFDHINACLARPEFRPRPLLDRFNIAFLATTEHALNPLTHHQKLAKDNLSRRITTTFRPDDVLDPDRDNFTINIEQLGALTNEATDSFNGYLNALRVRREFFKSFGATATDHGPANTLTANLDRGEVSRLYDRCRTGSASTAERELFRGQMLTEMARMSLDDGLVMQLHPGSWRNHNELLFRDFGADKGADIPRRVDFCQALHPLLNAVGNETRLELIIFSLDESAYSRELAPLAGHYPALRLGPPWWFHDSPEGILRFRRSTSETAGFFNTAGFNDDTRALLSIPARHDMARRMDCRFLAEWVTEGRMSEQEAMEMISILTTDLAVEAYRLEDRIAGYQSLHSKLETEGRN